METVLAAVNLDVLSDAVLMRAVQLASTHAARLVVLHVIEAEPVTSTAPLMHLTEDELRTQLEHQAKIAIYTQLATLELPQQDAVQVAFGAAHEVITQVAREQQADVIVLGANSGTALKEKLLGSTADRVIRSSAAPVLVVRNSTPEHYRRVAVAVDGSQHSTRVATETSKIVPQAALQLVHVIDIPIAFRQTLLRAGTSRTEVEHYRAALAEKARSDLAALQRDLPGMDNLPLRILDGEAGPALVSFAERARLDLLAVGSRGRGTTRSLLLGSVARYVLSEATCDVLVVANLR